MKFGPVLIISDNSFFFLFPVQTIVTLADSDDYRFVHVEAMGFTSSYNPRTSRGDHQVMVHVRQPPSFPWIPARYSLNLFLATRRRRQDSPSTGAANENREG